MKRFILIVLLFAFFPVINGMTRKDRNKKQQQVMVSIFKDCCQGKSLDHMFREHQSDLKKILKDKKNNKYDGFPEYKLFEEAGIFYCTKCDFYLGGITKHQVMHSKKHFGKRKKSSMDKVNFSQNLNNNLTISDGTQVISAIPIDATDIDGFTIYEASQSLVIK